MKLLLALLLTVLLLPPQLASQERLDSLRNACSTQKDSLLVDAHLQLGKYYVNTLGDIDSLLALSNRALNLCDKNNHAQKYQAKKQIAFAYVMRTDTVNTIPKLNDALQEARLTKDQKLVADIYHGFAGYYGNIGRTDSSLAYLIREAETAEEANYFNALAIAYSSIGWIYRGRQQFDLALSYHRKALKIVDKMERSNIGNIAQVYVTSSQGFLMAAQHLVNDQLMDSAAVLADSAMAIAVRDSRMAPQGSAYFVYCERAMYYKQYEIAEGFAYKALALRQFIDVRTKFLMYAAIAICNSHLKQPGKALAYLDSAQRSPALSELYYRNHFAEAAYKVHRNLGNYEAALAAHEMVLRTKDSLDNVQRTRSINEIEQQFNKAENEREIQRLASEQEITSLNNKLLTAGIGAAVLLALLIFLFYRQRNLKNEQERLLTEQRLARARMDPHFLFNTFTALQGLVLKEKDPVKAAGFLSDYSVIMRQTLESTFAELVTIEEEIAYLEKYLSLQQMRMAGKFDYSITTDDKVDPMDMLIAAMIIQPFVENSIEHAFNNLQHQGKLSVHFEIETEELKITISDNGAGYSDRRTEKAYPSRATGIIKDRLLLLNKKHKSNARFTLNSTSDGVSVVIYLPQLK